MILNIIRRTRPIQNAPVHRTQWLRISRRGYKWEGSQLEWLQGVRKEMVGRRSAPLRSSLSEEQQERFEEMLESVLPSSKGASNIDTGIVPLGHHLAFFNPEVRKEDLLPDGTDTLHSPGGPFTTRLWGGGSIRVDLDKYFGADSAWRSGRDFECEERIRAVRSSTSIDEPILVVVVERRFARTASTDAGQVDGVVEVDRGASVAEGDAPKPVDEWSLKEVRRLVFRKKEASPLSGLSPPLKPRYQPEFSHSLVPTETLLSQFSRLTLNHHLIHLDREYTRNVEGHRNLLVHGPLTLALMLRLLTNYLHTLPGPPRAVSCIEYSNVSPLYCDEPMRVCGRLGEQPPGAVVSKYDVWIEGPTGDMAVIAKVTVEPIPGATGQLPSGYTDIEPATKTMPGLGLERKSKSQSPAAPPELAPSPETPTIPSSRPNAHDEAAEKSPSKKKKKAAQKTLFKLHGVRMCPSKAPVHVPRGYRSLANPMIEDHDSSPLEPAIRVDPSPETQKTPSFRPDVHDEAAKKIIFRKTKTAFRKTPFQLHGVRAVVVGENDEAAKKILFKTLKTASRKTPFQLHGVRNVVVGERRVERSTRTGQSPGT